jgi:AcrR family transcriptional regulator
MGGSRSDTREKIRAVALELFAEHGYDKTSLRGVTKAALYYHFKSKEDIVASLFEDVRQEVDNIIAWGELQPPTRATRQEIIRRYAAMTHGPQGTALIRFMQDNRAAVDELKAGGRVRERFLRLAQLATDPTGTLPDQLRARLAFYALNTAAFLMHDLDITDEEREATALAVALDLVTGS